MSYSGRPLVLTLAVLVGASGVARGQQQHQQPGSQQEGTYETVSATASSSGDTGHFDVFSAYTLLKRKVAVSVFRHNVDRNPNDLDISNFIGTVAVGVTDRLELFGRFDVQRRIDADELGEPGYYNDTPRLLQGWASGFGDVTFGAKYNILSEYRDQPVGLAVRGFVKAATADTDEGLGTDRASGGAHLVVSKNLGERVESSYYAGFRGNGSPDEAKIGHAFEWGLGFSFPSDSKVRGMAELTGSVFTDADSEQTNPVDLLLGLNVQLPSGFFLSAGWRSNLTYEGPDNFGPGEHGASGFNVRIGYHPGVRGKYIPPPPPPPPPANRPPTVRVTANPPEVEEGADSRVTADAQDPDNDPLTYAWRAPDGRITGSGPQVTWTAPTGVEGSYPVTVTVDDGRGGTASDTTNIRVRRKVVRAIEFEDVHFLFDRYDLTDEARRILDQAVATLRDNPNLKIEIEGHCCSIGTEEYNLSLGARRADAVKTYLQRAGIEESRLTTISYGESRPAHDNSREVTRRLNRRAHLRVLITAPNEE
jgi:outer membrane protein OmpA-like peptidoglycan-associated protein